MKFDKNLAAIHGYLCSDGYVIKNPDSQKHKYYYIGLRNQNDVLLSDFQEKFEAVFGIKPIITNEGRCKIQNKEIYELLTKEFSYYSYEWKLPELNKEQLSYWLRAFFDCEGWVENRTEKYRRLIRAESCNEKGILSIQEALGKFNINSYVQKRLNRTIWRLTICDRKSILMFNKNIGFLHPKKKTKLLEGVASYKNFHWIIPTDKDDLFSFIKLNGKIIECRNQIRFSSIIRKNLIELRKALYKHSVNSKLFGPWISGTGSKYYCLIIKNYKEVLNGTEVRETEGYKSSERNNLGDTNILQEGNASPCENLRN